MDTDEPRFCGPEFRFGLFCSWSLFSDGLLPLANRSLAHFLSVFICVHLWLN